MNIKTRPNSDKNWSEDKHARNSNDGIEYMLKWTPPGDWIGSLSSTRDTQFTVSIILSGQIKVELMPSIYILKILFESTL